MSGIPQIPVKYMYEFSVIYGFDGLQPGITCYFERLLSAVTPTFTKLRQLPIFNVFANQQVYNAGWCINISCKYNICAI